jgi:hypothetical protein
MIETAMPLFINVQIFSYKSVFNNISMCCNNTNSNNNNNNNNMIIIIELENVADSRHSKEQQCNS